MSGLYIHNRNLCIHVFLNFSNLGCARTCYICVYRYEFLLQLWKTFTAVTLPTVSKIHVIGRFPRWVPKSLCSGMHAPLILKQHQVWTVWFHLYRDIFDKYIAGPPYLHVLQLRIQPTTGGKQCTVLGWLNPTMWNLRIGKAGYRTWASCNLTSLVSPGTNSSRALRDDWKSLPWSVEVNCKFDRCHSYDEKWKAKVLVAPLFLTLCDPMD